MKDESKNKATLIEELEAARKRIAELESRGEDWAHRFIQSSAMGAMIYRLDPDERLIFSGANPAADRLLGLDNSMFIGKTLQEAFPPLAETEIPEKYTNAARDGEPWHAEQVDYQDDQISGAYEVHAFQISKNRMVALFTDITARKQAEERLRESEKILRQSQEVAQLGSYDLDVMANKWTSSPILDAIFGIDESFPRTIPGWEGIIHPEYHLEMRNYLKTKVLGKGHSFDKEYTIIRQNDGEKRWVHGLGSLDFDDEGRTIRMTGTIQDVTESKQVEERLMREIAYTATTIQSMPGLFYVFYKESGRFARRNDNWSVLTGYTDEELDGMKALDFFAKGADRTKTLKSQEKVFVKGFHNMENNLLTKDGEKIPHYWTGRRIKLGDETFVVGMAIDISERKRAQEELRRIRET